MNKVCKLLEIVDREYEISEKIKVVLKISQNFNKTSQIFMENIEERVSKMNIVSSCLELHKKCLIDHCIEEIGLLFKSYEVMQELDSTRLLFLKKKMIISKNLLLKIIARNARNYQKLLVN